MLRYRGAMASAQTIGDHLREWRQRRRMSQLDLALEAEISARRLSFVETGRAQPSRDMVLRLAERLEVPLARTQRAARLGRLRAGFPAAQARRAGHAEARRAVDLVLKGHEPYPAIAIDGTGRWSRQRRRAARCSPRSDRRLLQPPVKVLRLSLHPKGLAPRIEIWPNGARICSHGCASRST